MKIKLPKVLWRKGKSKFIPARFLEEGISFMENVWWLGIGESAINRLYRKYNLIK